MAQRGPNASSQKWTVAGLLGLSVVASAMWACLSAPLELWQTARSDGSLDSAPYSDDGQAQGVLGLFTIAGCQKLTFPSDEPRCTGGAPLTVQLVLLPIGVSMYRWQVTPASGSGGADGGMSDGGLGSLLDETQSKSKSPMLTLAKPGTYLVSVAVAGPGGTSTASGQIIVGSGSVGASCDNDEQCDSGLRCLCGSDTPGRDGRCPGSIGNGVCTKSCDGVACPMGSTCLNLSRSSGTIADGGTGDGYRQPICVKPCSVDGDCRADLLCRELPVSKPGGAASDPISFGKVCFAAIPGAIGASCIGVDEQPDRTACATGLCESLGARHLCTVACGPSGVSCPTNAACATWNVSVAPAPTGPRCLSRCDMSHPCGDPLLDCLPGGGSGGLGFSLMSEPMSTQVCAPRRCSKAADCPGGRCVTVGAASFCLRN